MGHYQRWDIANLQLNMKKSEPFTVDYSYRKEDAMSVERKHGESEKENSIEK